MADEDILTDLISRKSELPFNLEAEAALLGALMIDNSCIDLVADLIEASDFYAPVHQRIYATVVQFHSEGRLVTPVTIKGHFDDDPGLVELGGAAYLAQLTAVGDGLLGPTDFAVQIRNLARRRTIIEGLLLAAKDCMNEEVPIASVIDQADAAIAQDSRDGIDQKSASASLLELVDSFGREPKGVLCGRIPNLDELHGLMEPKQLIIMAGRPGMGKSGVASSVALGAAIEGHGAMFVSLEMSRLQLAQRMAADLCYDSPHPVPYAAIVNNRLSHEDKQQIARAAGQIGQLPLDIIDTSGLTTARLAMLVRRQKRRLAARGITLGLVVIDYLQLLRPARRTNNIYEATSEVSKALKELAKSEDVAVLALTQLSREVEKREDKRPRLSDLRDSGQIEQDADSIIFLLRQEYYLQQQEPDEMAPDRLKWEEAMEIARGDIEFILAKRRNGTTGSAYGTFRGAYQAVR